MWIPVNGFENLYSINEYGDVKNIKTDKIMTPYINNKGYKMIDLSKNGKRYRFLVHRLVAIHYVPNPNGYPIVLHLDNIKTNTNYSNLKWGTYSENNHQAIKDGLNVVPKPDNRIYYNIINDNKIENIAYGINDLKNITEYPYSIKGLYSLIFRGNTIKNGPYSGCKIEQAQLQPAIYFDR